MREHEFRGKRIDNGEWVEGCLIKYNDGACIIMCSGERKQTRIIEGKPFYQIYAVTYEVDPNTIGEYTGLTDSKRTAEYPEGQKIFEGDIIRCGTDVMLVSWDVRLASFCLNRDGWVFSHFFGEAAQPETCEVIGNTTDTPELLEAGK